MPGLLQWPAGFLVMLKQLASLYKTALLLDGLRVQNHLMCCSGPAGLFAALKQSLMMSLCKPVVLLTGCEVQHCLMCCSGPAGLFAALELAQAGLPVVLLERGQPVEKRGRDIGALFVRRKLDQDSNLCYGQLLHCHCLTSMSATCVSALLLYSLRRA